MRRDIAKLNIVMYETDEGNVMEGPVKFTGTYEDAAYFLSHIIFGVLEVSPAESMGLFLNALKIYYDTEVEDRSHA